MNTQLEELVLQSLEHELGGVEVYTTAVECAVNADLKEEWTKYLAQTKEHTRKVQKLCEGLGIDPAKIYHTPTGRKIRIAQNGQAIK